MKVRVLHMEFSAIYNICRPECKESVMQQMNEWLDEVCGKWMLEMVSDEDLAFVLHIIDLYSNGGPEVCAARFLLS